MKRSAFRRRLKLLKERLPGIAPDTVWILQPENRRYLSGFRAEDGQLNESSGSLIISEKASLLITDSRYTAEAKKEAPDFEVITLRGEIQDGLPEILSDLGTRILGFEEDCLTWGLHRRLAAKLRKLSRPVRLSPLKGLVETQREVKDPEEIRAMEASARVMDQVLAEVINWLEPGLTERETARRIETLALDAGADGLAFPSIVGSGPNGALPHAVPTDRRLRAGEPIVFDVGVRMDGYRSDMTRTIFLGRPGPRFRKIYGTVREAQLAALDAIRPGVESTRPDSIAREVIKKAGFGQYFGHALGHGVGLATHERPRLSPRNPVVLKEGMVVTVEPGIYIPGKGGVRLEEMVVIEGAGPRTLTRDKHLYEF